MVFRDNIKNREFDRFVELNGETAVRTLTTQAEGSAINVIGAKNIKVRAFEIDAVSTEKSFTLETNLKKIIIRSRDNVTVKFSFEENGTDNDYFTLRKSNIFELSDLEFSGTLYVKADALTILEIIQVF